MSDTSFKGVPISSDPSSPSIMSPPSPINGDSHARASADNNSSVAPRLRTLEAQAQVQATEIALLRQLGDDVGSWRYRVDSASAQTAHVLQHLNKDLDELKTKVGELTTGEDAHLNRGAVDDLVSQMRDCYKDLQGALGRLHEGPSGSAASVLPEEDNLDGVAARLKDVEMQLASAHTLITSQDAVNTNVRVSLADIRASVAEVGAAADAAATDAAMAAVDATAATNLASAAISETSTLSGQIQALRLGLEVVEQTLEDLDVTDELASLRSRVDDLDSGIEHAGDEALAQISQIHATMEDFRREVARADEAAAAAALRAMQAEAATASISEDVAALRRDVQNQVMAPMVLPGMSAPASPARSVSSVTTATAPAPSDARLKAAVRTLSDGYQSLHRAMSMMYDEQSEVAERVTAVGKAAVASSQVAKGQRFPSSNKIMALNFKAGNTVFRSHPVSLASLLAEEEKEAHKNKKHTNKQANMSEEVAELRALMAAQAADAARQQSRAEAMEFELAEMKKLLCALAPAHVRNQLQPIVEINPTAALEEEFFEPIETVETEEEEIVLVKTSSASRPIVMKEESTRVGLRLVCNESTESVVATLNIPTLSSCTSTSNAQQGCRITRGVVGVATKEAYVPSSPAAFASNEETIPANWSSAN
ncbi:hypothetical protein Ndes2526B_g04476 [Nannochloris sp. 'desiccata']